MPRATAPDTLLITFAEAARLLQVSGDRLRSLIAHGHIQAHPILADRITRTEIERFATNYDSNAKADRPTDPDPAIGRTLDRGPAAESWGVPPLLIR